MEELNICTLFILSNQPTTQPAYQPKSEKCAYPWHLSTNLVEIWYAVSKWKDSTYVCDDLRLSMLTSQTSLTPIQPTCLKVENVHSFGIFQPIWLKLDMESPNGMTQHMLLIHKDFSMLNSQTGLLPNQPTT